MLPEVKTKGMSLMPRPLSNIERDETMGLVATVWKKKMWMWLFPWILRVCGIFLRIHI